MMKNHYFQHNENVYMERDIVQFVAMRNFLGVGGPNLQGAGLYLAKEVLADVIITFARMIAL